MQKCMGLVIWSSTFRKCDKWKKQSYYQSDNTFGQLNHFWELHQCHCFMVKITSHYLNKLIETTDFRKKSWYCMIMITIKKNNMWNLLQILILNFGQNNKFWFLYLRDLFTFYHWKMVKTRINLWSWSPSKKIICGISCKFSY